MYVMYLNESDNKQLYTFQMRNKLFIKKIHLNIVHYTSWKYLNLSLLKHHDTITEMHRGLGNFEHAVPRLPSAAPPPPPK